MLNNRSFLLTKFQQLLIWQTNGLQTLFPGFTSLLYGFQFGLDNYSVQKFGLDNYIGSQNSRYPSVSLYNNYLLNA